ncbi:ArsR/SmtB family transcription factor [Microbispora siamensis]
MDEVFKALADASRRRLLDGLNARNGQTLRELCAGLDMARQSVSKHLAVLEAANLVTTVWRGREKLHYLNALPLNAIADRWMSRFDRERARTLADLKNALEQWAEAVGLGEDVLARLKAERRSRVTFEIEPVGETVKLTVVHDGFDPGSTVREMVGEGWPQVLSALKTLLETGEPLPAGSA